MYQESDVLFLKIARLLYPLLSLLVFGKPQHFK